MKELFDKISRSSSRMTTRSYSTSFSLGIRFFNNKFHDPIYGIYGFVRFADEIVDSFHDYDKAALLVRYRQDTYEAIEAGISLNPILNNFQNVVRDFSIDRELIESFLTSMKMDLTKETYTSDQYKDYILGSAEVVGLMCLKVFCEKNEEKFNSLKNQAMKLGSAFQKINFLRDLQADYHGLGRTYFPGVDLSKWNDQVKIEIETDIAADFAESLNGIRRLPRGAQFGVYVAYVYFFELFRKIQRKPAAMLLEKRIRLGNAFKYYLLVKAYIKFLTGTL
jgi:15-cis-phytoene synthase